MRLWQKIIIPVIVVLTLFTSTITGTILYSVQNTLVSSGSPKIDLAAQVGHILEPLLIISILGLVTIIFVINFLIITRFKKLGKDLKEIGDKKNLSIRIQKQSDDEIGDLTSSINKMLEKIAASAETERKSNEKALAATDELRKNNDELGTMNKFMVDRELKMVELKKRIEELEKARPAANRAPSGS